MPEVVVFWSWVTWRVWLSLLLYFFIYDSLMHLDKQKNETIVEIVSFYTYSVSKLRKWVFFLLNQLLMSIHSGCLDYISDSFSLWPLVHFDF